MTGDASTPCVHNLEQMQLEIGSIQSEINQDYGGINKLAQEQIKVYFGDYNPDDGGNTWQLVIGQEGRRSGFAEFKQ